MTRHVSRAIIVENGKVLLQKREDFRIWEFPGGMVDPGETYAEAAIREAKEETGLTVKIVRHIADISQIQRDTMLHIYACKVVGGEIIKQGDETVDVGWFSVQSLPKRRTSSTDKCLRIAQKNHPEPIYETATYPFWLLLAHNIAISLRNLRNRYLR